MGVGMGDAATPGSTGGAPEQTPSGPGGPTRPTPALKWARRAGPGLPLPFLWIEKGVCEASARGSSARSGFREPLPGGRPHVRGRAQLASSPAGFKRARSERWEHRGCARTAAVTHGTEPGLSAAGSSRASGRPPGRGLAGPAVSPEAAGEPTSWPLISPVSPSRTFMAGVQFGGAQASAGSPLHSKPPAPRSQGTPRVPAVTAAPQGEDSGPADGLRLSSRTPRRPAPQDPENPHPARPATQARAAEWTPCAPEPPGRRPPSGGPPFSPARH